MAAEIIFVEWSLFDGLKNSVLAQVAYSCNPYGYSLLQL